MPDRPSLFDSPDLTYRMSMLPGATYRNPDGSERLEWALPSMITEPIDALYRLGQNSVLPDGRPLIERAEFAIMRNCRFDVGGVSIRLR